MTDQQAREFVQRLAVPYPTEPPPCPLCSGTHRLEQRCDELALRRVSHAPAERALAFAA